MILTGEIVTGIICAGIFGFTLGWIIEGMYRTDKEFVKAVAKLEEMEKERKVRQQTIYDVMERLKK